MIYFRDKELSLKIKDNNVFMSQHNDLGIRGELIAYDYLSGQGYQILEQNWVYDRCEIDIIASNIDFVIFVEVKTRRSNFWGRPEESVSKTKIQRIVKAADFYLKSYNIEKAARFDIISVICNGTCTEINHIEDAFMAPLNFGE